VSPALALDNTALSHFARGQRLEILKSLVGSYRCVAPVEVIRELSKGVDEHPALASAVALDWVETVELSSVEEVVAFARFKAELGGGAERNNGEAAVLAWISVNGGVGLIDERAARAIAEREGLEVHGTLWLIANAVRTGQFTREEAADMVDDLIATGMRLPTDGVGFVAFAIEEGLLEAP
jgi:predicted nucleic acid-binding protein